MPGPVEAHYDRFPYPRVSALAPPASPAHTAGVLSYLLRRRPDEALGDRPRVWVAGCGTQQASTWALTFPAGRVVGTDVSTATLERARAVASRIGLDDLALRRADLREGPPEGGPFDLVVCTGVVHHLDAPRDGMRAIADALAPGGAVILMVYSRAHRGPLAAARRAARRLADGAPDPYAVARAVLSAAVGPRCEPAARPLLERLVELADADPSFVADVLLNPVEHHYDVPSLHRLAAEAGLRVSGWLHPARWRLGRYVEDAALLARATALDPVARDQLVVDLTGLGSPLLEVLLEPADAPARSPYARAERLAMPLLLSGGARRYALDGDGPILPEEAAAFRLEGDAIVGASRGGGHAPEPWSLDGSLAPILEACDGRRTMAEILAAHGGSTPGLEAILLRLLPDGIGLLAPGWAC